MSLTQKNKQTPRKKLGSPIINKNFQVSYHPLLYGWYDPRGSNPTGEPRGQLAPFKASLKEELLRSDQRLASETGRWFGEIAGGMGMGMGQQERIVLANVRHGFVFCLQYCSVFYSIFVWCIVMFILIFVVYVTTI